MYKSIWKTFILWLIFSLGFFWWILILVKASSLTVTSWNPLTAWNWNDMVKNFFWWSGSGWIYYNGKVWIGTNAPNKDLHIYDTTNNAEIDLQSVSWAWKHWWIYQDATSQELRMWNWYDRVKITTWWNLNAQWLCINWDCKTDWSQVWWWSSWIYQFTWTSIACNSSNAGKVKYSWWNLYMCNGTSWLSFAWNIQIMTINWAKMWSDWSYAKSCRDYKNPSWLYSYVWEVWDGVYWIQHTWAISAYKAYCDMTTDWWWWTLVLSKWISPDVSPWQDISVNNCTSINTTCWWHAANIPFTEYLQRNSYCESAGWTKAKRLVIYDMDAELLNRLRSSVRWTLWYDDAWPSYAFSVKYMQWNGTIRKVRYWWWWTYGLRMSVYKTAFNTWVRFDSTYGWTRTSLEWTRALESSANDCMNRVGNRCWSNVSNSSASRQTEWIR